MKKQKIEEAIIFYLLHKVNMDFMERRIKEGRLPLTKNQIEDLAISISAIQEQSVDGKVEITKDNFIALCERVYKSGVDDGKNQSSQSLPSDNVICPVYSPDWYGPFS